MNEIDYYAKQIQELSKNLKDQNRANQSMKRRLEALSSTPVVKDAGGLSQNLQAILPPELLPGNVGQLNNVAWDFFFELTLDLGTNPSITSNTRVSDSVQVTQESAFCLTGIYRHANNYGDSGDLGPLQITIQDLQSTRFFNAAPIPIQAIGQKGRPTVLPSPLLFMPNAKIQVEMTSWLANGVTQTTLGSGLHKIILEGFRVRVEDAANVLSNIYG